MPEQAREIPEPKAARVGHGPSAGTDTGWEGTARGDAEWVLRLLRFITEMETADPGGILVAVGARGGAHARTKARDA